MNTDKALDILTLEQAAAILERDNPDQAARNVIRWLRNRARRMKDRGQPWGSQEGIPAVREDTGRTGND
jgi:hypothetical protein